MAFQDSISPAGSIFVRMFEGTMNFFGRIVDPRESVPVTAEDLQASFNYLRTINPDGAEDLLKCFKHTARQPNSTAICPSELPATYRNSLMGRTEIAIRAAERANSCRLNS